METGGAPMPGALPPGEESFIGTHSLYVFFRLHNILYERLKQAREISESVRSLMATGNDHASHIQATLSWGEKLLRRVSSPHMYGSSAWSWWTNRRRP